MKSEMEGTVASVLLRIKLTPIKGTAFSFSFLNLVLTAAICQSQLRLL